MNVIAKSANIVSLTRATAAAVSNGSVPVAATSKVQKHKISVPEKVTRCTSYSIAQDLFDGPIRVGSGPAGLFNSMHMQYHYSIVHLSHENCRIKYAGFTS